LASSFQRAWETIGNSYEALTTGPAPGNGARTVPNAHNHTNGKTGSGVTVAQAACRWQGRSNIVNATAFPHSLSYLYAWAGLVEIYTQQEVAVVIVGDTGDGSGGNVPGSVVGGLDLQLNGVSMPFGFENSNDRNTWMIGAGLGVLAPGTYHLALKISTLNTRAESWSVIGAEVWCSQNQQMVLPP
tara:strand:- start:771 stop:1328 length:558 start_codon:yes stop_codon:yes gene_type:complete